MRDEPLEADAVEEPVPAGEDRVEVVRPLPERRAAGELDAWRGEARAVAVAVAGGIAAGAATVAAVGVVRARAAQRRQSRRLARRREKNQGIVASRSFLIDVHLLDR